MKQGSVYRYGDRVALWAGSGETRYLTAEQALILRQALARVLADISEREFTKSTVGTANFETLTIHEGNWSEDGRRLKETRHG